ncbi:MAG TPA: spermidine/putrescine ABC transporter substrate-binding protein [Thermomicrobiales bacterium]|nr:spermidine/putrescine ABC transporter substrate-binding protein [Thermomicrobiales bacterium]
MNDRGFTGRPSSRRGVLRTIGGAAALAAGARFGAFESVRAFQATPAPQKIGGSLNILVQAGYDEPPIVQPFEEMYGVKVNSKVFPSSDEMFSMLQASKPGDWDVTVPDTPWIAKLQAASMIDPLDPADFPMIQDQYDRWQKFDQLFVDGKQYGIVSRWGLYGIVYNSQYVTADEAQTIGVMYDPKYKGKVVLFDWYLPNMGMVGRYVGLAQPYDATGADFDKIKQKTFDLRPQVGVIAATNTDTIQAIANESGYLSFGGEWLQLLLKEQGHPIELAIPKEGGVSWTEALVQLKGSQNPAAAKAFMQYILSPQAQAKLAWANAFHATVPNKLAAKYLTPEQAAALRMDDPAKINAILANIATRKLPADEQPWIDAWDEFKSM